MWTAPAEMVLTAATVWWYRPNLTRLATEAYRGVWWRRLMIMMIQHQ